MAAPADWAPHLGRGVVSHSSAALLWGLPLIGSHGRHRTMARGGQRYRDGWTSHWATLAAGDIVEASDGTRLTSALRTVMDCGRFLPLYPAVAIVDAALHDKLVSSAELVAAVATCHLTGAAALRRAVRWSDRRADSAQESVGRVALGLAGLPATPQFILDDGPLDHAYDLAIEFAKVVVDLQSKKYHSPWPAVVKDYEHLNEVNLVRGWKLTWSLPHMVLPDPHLFVRRVLDTVVTQPGPRCAALRRRYVDADGWLTWPGTTGRR